MCTHPQKQYPPTRAQPHSTPSILKYPPLSPPPQHNRTKRGMSNIPQDTDQTTPVIYSSKIPQYKDKLYHTQRVKTSTIKNLPSTNSHQPKQNNPRTTPTTTHPSDTRKSEYCQLPPLTKTIWHT